MSTCATLVAAGHNPLLAVTSVAHVDIHEKVVNFGPPRRQFSLTNCA